MQQTDEVADPHRIGAARVIFVGAGPGDPELLTLAAIGAIKEADMVIADDRPLLDLVMSVIDSHATALVTSLDELGLGDFMTSAEKGEITVEAAKSGKTVVRLVSGDPFLDSGSAAEAATCVRSGVRFEVVPGVSMLTSVPEYAGVSLTDADGVQFVTVSESADLSAEAPYWGFSGTLVVALRANRVSDFAVAGLEAGRLRSEPVLATLHGGSTSQRSITTTLGDLPYALTGIPPTALLHVVVGGGATHGRDELDWFESKPLFGWRVLVPRTKDQATPMTARLRGYGAQIEEVATISVERPRTPQQMDKAVRGLVEGAFHWVVFTSNNAVKAVREKFEEYGLDARAFSGLKVAAAGGPAADALKAWGIEPDLVPVADQSAVGLGAEFPEYDPSLDPINRVFLPRADIATETLSAALVKLGWEVEDVTAYRTVRAAPPPAPIREGIKAGSYDAVLFSSSSTVRNFVGIAGKPHTATIIAAIGPATAKACEEHGLRVDALAEAPSGVELADALAKFATRRRESMITAGQKFTRPSQRMRRRRS